MYVAACVYVKACRARAVLKNLLLARLPNRSGLKLHA